MRGWVGEDGGWSDGNHHERTGIEGLDAQRVYVCGGRAGVKAV